MNGQDRLRDRQSEAAHGGKPEDLRLIALVRVGDLQAFEQLYRLYHPRLSRFLFHLVRRPQLVEEVINDTLMVVWERAATFNGASKLSTWIFAIANRKAMKALRRQDEPVEDTRAEERLSLDPSPEQEAGQHRLQALLMDAMTNLSPEHRAVVTLTYFQGMGYREFASIMECPVDTVKTRMFHARRQLRRRLAGEFADWL